MPDDLYGSLSAFLGITPESGKALFESMFWHLDLARATVVEALKVRCPLLCIAGSEDKVISPATARVVAEKYFLVSGYLEFPGFSHWLIGKPDWQIIANACAEWTDALPAGA